MSFTNKVQVDTLRSIAFGSITGSYTPVGTPFSYQARLICFTNTTDKDLFFSMNGTTDQIIVPAGSFKLLDLTTNHRPVNMDDFVLPIGTQWSVRYGSAPTTGNVYIEVVYAQPN